MGPRPHPFVLLQDCPGPHCSPGAAAAPSLPPGLSGTLPRQPFQSGCQGAGGEDPASPGRTTQMTTVVQAVLSGGQVAPFPRQPLAPQLTGTQDYPGLLAGPWLGARPLWAGWPEALGPWGSADLCHSATVSVSEPQRLGALSPPLTAAGQQPAKAGVCLARSGGGRWRPWNLGLGRACETAPQPTCCQALGPSPPVTPLVSWGRNSSPQPPRT